MLFLHPHHPIPGAFHRSRDFSSVARLESSKPHTIRSQWHNIKAAKLVGTPSSKEEKVDETIFRFLEFKFEVPLDHNEPAVLEGTLSLYAKLVYGECASDVEHLSDWKAILESRKQKSLLLYLCGGPGDGNPLKNSALMKTALEDGYHILYVDYRGTGNSSPIRDLAKVDIVKINSAKAAEYLAMFRQDSIVKDLEAIRLSLEENLSSPLKYVPLGQSFGGWIILTYLSFLPTSLERAAFHAALAPIRYTPEQVYKSTFVQVMIRNEAYYNEYPKDRDLVRRIMVTLERDQYAFTAADGSQHKMSGRSFMTVGRALGTAGGNLKIHNLVQHMIADLDTLRPGQRARLSSETHEEYLDCLGFKLHTRPLYAVLHEAIYCSSGGIASEWAAERVGKKLARQRPEFSWLSGDLRALQSYKGDLYFSGEMIYPFMLESAGEALLGFKKVADELARKKDWPELYNETRLRRNRVPIRALVYPDDMYVAEKMSIETANMMPNCKVVPVPKNRGWTHGAIKEPNNAPEAFRLLVPRYVGR